MPIPTMTLCLVRRPFKSGNSLMTCRLNHCGNQRRIGAFTLVEILIVVVVLGILAAIVVPQFSDASQQATISTLRSSLHSIRVQIDLQHQNDPAGGFPATIDTAWFAGNALPAHPGNSFGVPAVQVQNSNLITHPLQKVLKAGVAGAFWYNSANGAIRARITDLGSSTATLDAYNLINDSSESGLGNYGGGGGS